MNDNDLITAVREAFTDLHFTTPAAQIVRRGRTVRARRRIPVVTGALAVAAGAAVGLTALLPASHPASHQPPVRLAAWTVTKLPDGNIKVTIRELKDPAGLQRTLRADGVPASVTFTSQENAACRLYPGGTPGQPPHNTPLLLRVFPKPYQLFPKPYQRSHGPVIRPGRARSTVAHARSNRLRISPHLALIVIHPPALPGNAGVQIATVYQGQRGAQAVDMPTVVYASRRCTGS
jgi:hypothetical protein